MLWFLLLLLSGVVLSNSRTLYGQKDSSCCPRMERDALLRLLKALQYMCPMISCFDVLVKGGLLLLLLLSPCFNSSLMQDTLPAREA
jgi:hypothetical protein